MLEKEAPSKIIQLATGGYSFSDEKHISHVVYGLDDNGDVWKMNPKTSEWININYRNEQF